MKKFLLLSFGFLFLIVKIAISQTIPINTEQSNIYTLEQGECVTIKLSADSLRWSIGNQDIVVVDENGRVCATGAGETYVAARSPNGKFQKQFQVTVRGSKADVSNTDKFDFQEQIDDDVQAVLDFILKENNPPDKIDTRLTVSENRRHLVYKESGEPFLFLGQTLWSMARRLDREEIIKVLDICQEQGFTAIQVLAHGHYMGANPYGNEPFDEENFLRPLITLGSNFADPQSYDWWDHLEFILDESIKRGMFVCLLPTWREQWNQKDNLHAGNALAYGKFIGMRYRKYNPWIIWVMGGDHHPEPESFLQLHRDLAKGVSIGVNGEEMYDNMMMTYHTHGPTSTVDYFPEDEPFMHFNTIQSGHSMKNLEGMIENGYERQHKPILDFEPNYTKDGENTNEVRTTIYWGVFSGGFGTSYGSWNIWHCGARNDIAEFSIPEAFQEGFGDQIRFLGKLLQSRPMLLREPNQDLLVDNTTQGMERIKACLATNGSYAMIYTPHGTSFRVNASKISGRHINWYWYCPRSGEVHSDGKIINRGQTLYFDPPSTGESFSGHDWVLVLDDAKYGYSF